MYLILMARQELRSSQMQAHWSIATSKTGPGGAVTSTTVKQLN